MTIAIQTDSRERGAADDLIAFIQELAGLSRLDVDQELLDTGLVSSLDMVEVLLFINQRFGVELDPTALIPENLSSVGRMLALVDRCRTAAAG